MRSREDAGEGWGTCGLLLRSACVGSGERVLASDPVLAKSSPRAVITALGITQVLAWGSSFYLPAVLAQPIAADTGWPLGWAVVGLSVGLLAADLVTPRVGRTIDAKGGRPVLVASAILLAAGLATLAIAHSVPVYLIAWLVMGVGMGSVSTMLGLPRWAACTASMPVARSPP
jgi:MFS family permease